MLVIVTQIGFAAGETPAGGTPENKYLKYYESSLDNFSTPCDLIDLAPPTPGEIAEDILPHVLSPVDRVVEKYHEMMNCLFNQKIEKLAEKFLAKEQKSTRSRRNSRTGRVQKTVATKKLPLSQKELDELFKLLSSTDCSEESLSTYCLSREAVLEYFEFRGAMKIIREQEISTAADRLQEERASQSDPWPVRSPLIKAAGGAIADFFTGKKSLEAHEETLDQIDGELATAQTALDHALAAYNEMQMAVPLHRKYQEVIEQLEDYRDQISDIRKDVELYPETLLDVTTPACT